MELIKIILAMVTACSWYYALGYFATKVMPQDNPARRREMEEILLMKIIPLACIISSIYAMAFFATPIMLKTACRVISKKSVPGISNGKISAIIEPVVKIYI